MSTDPYLKMADYLSSSLSMIRDLPAAHSCTQEDNETILVIADHIDEAIRELHGLDDLNHLSRPCRQDRS